MDIQHFTFTGKVVNVQPVGVVLGKKVQWITFQCRYNNPMMKDDFFNVQCYGANDIIEFWKGYQDSHPPFTATVTVQVRGTYQRQKNNITFKFKKITWNYI